MSAVQSRSRRSTAGKRMSSLVGKALEEDEAFWSHSTWDDKAPLRASFEDDDDDDHSQAEQGEESSMDGSYNIDDEAPEDRIDTFDSDFNDSETEEETGDDDQAEEELRRDELRAKKKKTALGMADIVAAGRQLLRKKKKQPKKALMGEGINAGLVLNLPPPTSSYSTTTTALATTPASLNDGPLPPSTTATTGPAAPTAITSFPTPKPLLPSQPTKPTTTKSNTTHEPTPTLASTRARRSSAVRSAYSSPHPTGHPHDIHTATATIATNTTTTTATTTTTTVGAGARNRVHRRLRAATIHKTIETDKSIAQQDKQSERRRKQIERKAKKHPPKRKFTQEELLLEAATITEGENERWILSRKRYMSDASYNQDRDGMVKKGRYGGDHNNNGATSGSNAKVIMKFHSRRGSYNTLTFPEMDMVPEILTRRHTTAPTVSTVMKNGNTKKRPRSVSIEDVIENDQNEAREKEQEEEQEVEEEKEEEEIDSITCVITGKKARYRDPKTMRGYHDIAAFKELRRRYEAGEPLVQRLNNVTRNRYDDEKREEDILEENGTKNKMRDDVTKNPKKKKKLDEPLPENGMETDKTEGKRKIATVTSMSAQTEKNVPPKSLTAAPIVISSNIVAPRPSMSSSAPSSLAVDASSLKTGEAKLMENMSSKDVAHLAPPLVTSSAVCSTKDTSIDPSNTVSAEEKVATSHTTETSAATTQKTKPEVIISSTNSPNNHTELSPPARAAATAAALAAAMFVSNPPSSFPDVPLTHTMEESSSSSSSSRASPPSQSLPFAPNAAASPPDNDEKGEVPNETFSSSDSPVPSPQTMISMALEAYNRMVNFQQEQESFDRYGDDDEDDDEEEEEEGIHVDLNNEDE